MAEETASGGVGWGTDLKGTVARNSKAILEEEYRKATNPIFSEICFAFWNKDYTEHQVFNENFLWETCLTPHPSCCQDEHARRASADAGKAKQAEHTQGNREDPVSSTHNFVIIRYLSGLG